MRLSILLFCCFHGTCWTLNNFCVYQPKTLSVKEGDSVTVPCSFTYLEELREKSQIIVNWGERDGPTCSKIKKSITDGSGNIMDEYKDRMSIIKSPNNNRTESLIIRGVKASDGITFCCRATILPFSYTWYDTYGTSLHFAGGKWVSQLEEVIAIPGEEVIIPCHYSLETLGEARTVSWYMGDYDGCVYSEKDLLYTWDQPQTYSRYSLVNFPEDVSLRIHSVQQFEVPHYCCKVTTSKGKTESKLSTTLAIAGFPFSFTVTQPNNITAHRDESVTLNCSYSQYMESEVLGVNIYWRAGNISGPYAYHPYKEMVHPRYSGRTEIKGAADLHIRGLQTSDDSIYYCFVMFKMCKGKADYQRLIQYGEGSRLIVTDVVQPHLHPTTVIFVSYIACKFFMSLALFLLALFYYKYQ
ncbi:uncharacterized protein ACNLHF_015667 [Anomaloglossus baeobatrachus]|uniref:uncharacterized protein LOC142302122 n=1 Tax=Anomaloglossus baeobatrachus TaxID=238106 RepID=UPI003F4FA0A3